MLLSIAERRKEGRLLRSIIDIPESTEHCLHQVQKWQCLLCRSNRAHDRQPANHQGRHNPMLILLRMMTKSTNVLIIHSTLDQPPSFQLKIDKKLRSFEQAELLGDDHIITPFLIN